MERRMEVDPEGSTTDVMAKDGMAGSPDAGTLKDGFTCSVDMHDRGDDPEPCPGIIRTHSDRMWQDIIVSLLPTAAGADGVGT